MNTHKPIVIHTTRLLHIIIYETNALYSRREADVFRTSGLATGSRQMLCCSYQIPIQLMVELVRLQACSQHVMSEVMRKFINAVMKIVHRYYQ